nr:hypothetical protein [Bacteroidota bacterium]
MVQKINVSKISIERHIQILRDSGRVKRIGSTKSGKWIVTK